jgi:hypothetical protein
MITSTHGTFGWAVSVFAALRGEIITTALDAAWSVTAKPSIMAVVLTVMALRWAPIDLVRFYQSFEKR